MLPVVDPPAVPAEPSAVVDPMPAGPDGVRAAVLGQFEAALAMLGNAIAACPAGRWAEPGAAPAFWYLVYHTLFWLDHYLAPDPADFRPPPPFGLEELDPSGVLPPRVYRPDELLGYLAHGRARLRAVLHGPAAVDLAAPRTFGSIQGTLLEVLLYNLRHVQHHAAQCNLLLRQGGVEPPRWVARGPA